tara:strand:+ start:62234 stop:63406 length:1173 start_codon:yes stop_codon:yes gene_type:complete
MSIQWNKSQRGGIYVVTLITVAAIASMVLIGVNLRSSTNKQSALIEQMVEGSSGVLNAAELAIERVISDNDWKETAKTGVVFSDLVVADSQYTSTVVDADTSAKPDDSTTTYRITVAANHDTAQSKARFDIVNSTVDYDQTLDEFVSIFYWPLNEKDKPTEAIDTLTRSHHGTYIDPSIAGASTNDEGAPVPLFNDANDHIEIPWDNSLIGLKGTFSLWMKSTESNFMVSYGLLGAEYVSGGNPNIMLTIFSRGLYAYISNSSSYSPSEIASSSTRIVTLDTWHHVAVTWGGTGLTIYLDGIQVAQNTSNIRGLGTGHKSMGGQQPLRVGEATIVGLGGSTSDEGFKGSIAHLVYIKDCLTDAEVAELAAIKPDLDESGIIEDSWVRVFE